MKHLFCFCTIMWGLLSFDFAQSNSLNAIPLYVHVSRSTEMPETAVQYLENKLNSIAIADGVVDFVICNRFVLLAKVDVINKDIVTGPPQKISQTLSITLQIGDVQNHTLFASTNLTSIGIGTNITKSFMEAFKDININNKQINNFLIQGKGKVKEYYEQNCKDICEKANKMADAHQYDTALYMLSSIPDLGSDCYIECANIMVNIVNRKINEESLQQLYLAKLAWTKSQNEDGAIEAMNFLQNIHPTANCQKDVDNLIKEMQNKIKTDDNRAWQFKMKQYNDNVQKERLQAQNEQEVRKMSIKAARDAAIAFAEHLPQYDIILW